MNLELLIVTTTVFGSAYLFQSIFGFGAALISLLTLSLFIPTTSVIAMIPITVITACSLNVFTDLRSVQWKPGLRIFAYAVPGMGAGAFFLSSLNSDFLTIFASVLILIYVLYSLAIGDMKYPKKLELPIALVAGFIAMICGFAALFVPMVMRRVEIPRHLRATLNLLWVLMSLIRLPLYFAHGLITKEYVLYSLAALPLIILAMIAGRRIARGFTVHSFRRWVLLFLALLASTRIVVAIV